MTVRWGWVAMVLMGCGTPSPGTDPTAGDDRPGDGSTGVEPGPGQTVTSSPSPEPGTGTSSDEDDTAGFVAPPDGGVAGQCDPFLQDCPRGEKCTSYVSTPGEQTVDATKCVPIVGMDAWGEPCERMPDNDTCAPGFFCMTDVSGHTGTGTCLEYCTAGEPCTYGGECFSFNDGALPVCEVLCDPLVQDCPAGQGCYAAFDSFVCAMPGAPEGQGNDGDPCATVQGCNPGLLCRTGTAGCPMDGACCTPVCEVSGPPDQCIDPSEACVQALDDPPPGLEDAGYCGVPQ